MFDNFKLTYYKLKQNEREFNATYTGGFGEPGYDTEVIEVESDPRPQHVRVLNNVADAILGIEPLYIDGREGIRGVELADAMLLSTWLDKTIQFPIDDEVYYEELKKRIAVSRLKKTDEVVLNTEGTYGSKK